MRLKPWLAIASVAAFASLLTQACGDDDTGGGVIPSIDAGNDASVHRYDDEGACEGEDRLFADGFDG